VVTSGQQHGGARRQNSAESCATVGYRTHIAGIMLLFCGGRCVLAAQETSSSLLQTAALGQFSVVSVASMKIFLFVNFMYSVN
jgi:hypothetical protein